MLFAYCLFLFILFMHFVRQALKKNNMEMFLRSHMFGHINPSIGLQLIVSISLIADKYHPFSLHIYIDISINVWHQSVCLHLSICLLIFLSLSLDLSIYLSIYLSVYLSIYLSPCNSFSPSLSISISLSFHPYHFLEKLLKYCWK